MVDTSSARLNYWVRHWLTNIQDLSSIESEQSPPQTLQLAMSPDPPKSDFYTLALSRLINFKRGASFSEHSPLLHQLSTFQDWKKPHAGLRKMFVGEVIGKRVVIQGLWIGGWCWGEDSPAEGTTVKPGSTTAPWTTGKSAMLEEANRAWGER
jgi:hypothetical protein